ncbi:MAG: NDP-sugar synthase [Puniceicoccaceae bacterium]
MPEEPTLLVLAAGMGSRYGGLKQLDPMGPHKETILDYSVHDAIQAGFKRIVFVIRRDIETAFKETIGKRYSKRIEIDYAFQELTDLPEGYTVPDSRTKPWGTGHAVWAARHAVSGPFAVINADDFYSADAYRVIADYFDQSSKSGTDPLCMVSYALENTLSRHGSVNRGLCQVDKKHLVSVEEIIDIERDREGVILGENGEGREVQLKPDSPVSMNFWGFSSEVFDTLGKHFQDFLKYNGRGLTTEFYIPAFVDDLISKESAVCDVLQTSARWFGVTYPGDKPYVQQHIARLIEDGVYPSPLDAS